MRHIFIIILLLFTVDQFQAQIVNIPDTNFKNVLLNDSAINTNFDNEIQVSEAEAATELQLHYEDISDLTGLEAFINLNVLLIQGNFMTTIDLTSNTALINLSISVTPISSLNLSNNTSLLTLELVTNPISDLDLSNNLELQDVYMHNNQFVNVNLGNNTSLEDLTISSNEMLSELDISANTSLKMVEVVNNGLTSLDVTNNIHLEILRTYGNDLTELDISNNTMLTELNTMFNQLVTLDLSNNPNLTWFNGRNNQLEMVDARNGNNHLFVNFNVLNNLNLECILVDDPIADYLFSWLVDENILFGSNNQDCQPLSITESEFITENIYPNPFRNTLFIDMVNDLEQIDIYNINGQLVKQEYLKIPSLQYKMNLNHLQSGIYFIKIRTKSSELTKKIIKM